MAELLNVDQLSRITGIHSKAVLQGLEKLNIEPVHVTRLGRGVLRLYSKDAVDALNKLAEKDKSINSVTPMRPAVSANTNSSDRLEQIDSLAMAVSEMYDKLELVSQQHASLLRAVERSRDELMGAVTLVANHVRGIEDIVKVLKAQADAPAVVVESAPTPPAPVITNNVVDIKPAANEPKDTRKHVAILALPNGHRDAIKKEFKDVFRLEFFESDEVNSRTFPDKMGRFDAVFGMTGFLNHGISKVTHAAGPKFISVRGGVSSLRDKLTELFVKVA